MNACIRCGKSLNTDIMCKACWDLHQGELEKQKKEKEKDRLKPEGCTCDYLDSQHRISCGGIPVLHVTKETKEDNQTT